jgi:hypothetical protein
MAASTGALPEQTLASKVAIVSRYFCREIDTRYSHGTSEMKLMTDADIDCFRLQDLLAGLERIWRWV